MWETKPEVKEFSSPVVMWTETEVKSLSADPISITYRDHFFHITKNTFQKYKV